MGVERKYLFDDKKATIEYYEHEKIILRVCGLLIKIYKPCTHHRYRDNKNVTKDPVIQLSTNCTIDIDILDLKYVNKAILTCIDILNSEEDNLKIDINKAWTDETIEVSNLNIKNTKKTEIKYIKDIKPLGIYEDIKQNRWMYISKGLLIGYFDSRSRIENRMNSEYIYAKLDDTFRYHFITDGTLVLESGYQIDTYVTKKRFIKVVEEPAVVWNKCIVCTDAGIIQYFKIKAMKGY